MFGDKEKYIHMCTRAHSSTHAVSISRKEKDMISIEDELTIYDVIRLPNGYLRVITLADAIRRGLVKVASK